MKKTSFSSKTWPSNGAIEFRNFSLSYNKDRNNSKANDMVLKNLDLKIEGGTRVGIVGRTGAGTIFLFVLILYF